MGEGFRWNDLKDLNIPLDRTGSNQNSSLFNNNNNANVNKMIIKLIDVRELLYNEKDSLFENSDF